MHDATRRFIDALKRLDPRREVEFLNTVDKKVIRVCSFDDDGNGKHEFDLVPSDIKTLIADFELPPWVSDERIVKEGMRLAAAERVREKREARREMAVRRREAYGDW